MSYISDLAKQGNTTSSGSYISSLAKSKKTSTDLSTLEGLTTRAQEVGLGQEAAQITETTPRLSFLQRLGSGLGAFNPAEAILTGTEKGAVEGVKKYATGIVKGIGGAITGRDYEQGGRRYFKDVAEKLGVENGIAKFGIGFLGDVLLDPSTYFGGVIARGIGATAKGATSIGLKTLGKVAPETEAGLRMAGTGIKDALGRAFQYGYKSTKGAMEDVFSFLTKKQQAKIGLASSNLNRLGTGILTEDQSKELALKMIAGKRAEFVGREAGKTTEELSQLARQAAETTDPVVKKTIEEQIIRSKKFAEGITENPYETYFPFLKKDKIQKFLNETTGIRVGSEGYRKQFKNLLTNENLELDPAKAFFTRESQIVSDRMTKDFLNGFVKKYGKGLDYFTNSDDAAKAGYSIIKEKGIFGKDIGYVSKYDANLIKDALSPEFQTVNMLAKATGFDMLTSLFKRSVTGLFAPFHVRNFVSGQIQNFETLGVEALNPKNIAIGQKIAYLIGKGEKIPSGTINIAGKILKTDDVFKPFVERFSGDTFYNADFDFSLKSGNELKQVAKVFSKERLKETIKTVGLGTESIPFKLARTVGQFIEHQQKATAYITALGQGKTIPEALRLAETAGFDYRALTRFESQILRRLIPFYSFTRKNIELQLRTLGENPQRINQVSKFFENIGEKPTQEEKKDLPSYVKESLAVKLGKNAEGLAQFITGFGTPIEQFANLFRGGTEQTFQKRFEGMIYGQLSSFNPLIKAPIEIGIGKDSFRQRDLKDVYDAKEYSAAPQIIKDLLDIKAVKKAVLAKNKQGKLVKVGERTQYIADPARLLIARSLFTSRGVSYLDQIFDGDLKGLTKILKLSTGLKPQAIDIEMQKSIKQRDMERAMQDLLTKYGAASQYTKVYVPKND